MVNVLRLMYSVTFLIVGQVIIYVSMLQEGTTSHAGKPMWERRWNRRTELGKLIKNCSNFADMIPVKLQPPQDYVLGQILDVSAFAGCTYVKVTGITKGKGFAGVIKRHGFSRYVNNSV